MDKSAVVDASILIKLLSREKESLIAEAERFCSLITRGKIQAFAPTFLLVEMLNVLSAKKHFTEEGVTNSLEWLKRLGIVFVDFNIGETDKIVGLCYRHNLTAYDALYLLLATNLGCKLVTEDEKLLRIKKHCLGLEDCLRKVF